MTFDGQCLKETAGTECSTIVRTFETANTSNSTGTYPTGYTVRAICRTVGELITTAQGTEHDKSSNIWVQFQVPNGPGGVPPEDPHDYMNLTYSQQNQGNVAALPTCG
jgi:hypothetical protein